MPRLGVIGIGNTLMGDDGIGMVLLERMQENPTHIPGVEYIHGGVGGMNILHDLAGLDVAIIMDTANFGGDPGEYRIFSPEEVESTKFLPRESLHEADLLKVLELSRALGECPGTIRIFAVQPGNLEMGKGLSAALSKRIEEYEESLMALINELRSE
jgi:hydrogenase maturation protease